MAQGEPNKWYKWFGNTCGNLFNTHQEWEKAPQWMKASYKLEMEYLGGDIDTPLSGAAKGLVEAGEEYFKRNPADAFALGKYIFDTTKIKPDQAFAFATGFMETASPK